MRTTFVSRLGLAALASGWLGAGDVAAQVPPVGEPGGPTAPLSSADMRTFLRGFEIFDSDFHRASGLGAPEFNATSCRACHERPAIGGAGTLELNVSRFGHDNGGLGPFENVTGGQILSKLRPPWEEGRENYDPATADVFEQRQTPSLLGLGLMQSISEAEILSNQDPTDGDGDGIYGVARLLDIGGSLEVGRFGWKAQIPRIEDFVRDGMANELGISSPDDGRGFALLSDGDATPDPEASEGQVDDMAFFLQNLGPPLRKGSTDPQVAVGEGLFASVGCITCHRVLQGPSGPVALYSDLLLHNVMAPGFRGMGESGAPVGFYRTPPLWGIGETAPYMHDGRAVTLLDAIAAHEGEATGVVAAFDALTAPQKQAVLLFLQDL